MTPRQSSRVADRLTLVRWKESGQTLAGASQALGYRPVWGRTWWRRYRAGGEAALRPVRSPAPGPLATFAPAVRQAALAYRRAHPRVGARRARLALEDDPPLHGLPLPSPSTRHRAWVAAGPVPPRLPRDAPAAPIVPPPAPADLHAIWELDHQDGLHLAGVAMPVVLQDVRAPAAGLIVGADLFLGPHGAQAVPVDDVLDALRRHLVTWGRPLVLSVDRDVRFFGQPQRQFPSRLELFCAGLGIAVVPIRPAHPTDHGAVERQHRTPDGVVLGPTWTDLAAAQTALDAHVVALNTRFPSRARVCGGQPPLRAHPTATHSGRPYDPAREWDDFDLEAVDRVLATWVWHRLVGKQTGQISFGNRNVSVGMVWAGQPVTLRFDPADRQVVVAAPGAQVGATGPTIKRFHCPAFDQATILGHSSVAPRPVTAGGTPA